MIFYIENQGKVCETLNAISYEKALDLFESKNHLIGASLRDEYHYKVTKESIVFCKTYKYINEIFRVLNEKINSTS